ncbi:Sucrase/ferredoxin-like-domain-containing protein [Cytidiella melzeri]|nr:Sucrase/ferredoxin-like-domain-containing protein [Cytidiella melzeri]
MLASRLRSVKAIVLGHNTDMDTTAAMLKDAQIPVSEDPCRGCADPCDEGHDEYPSRFDVDMETQLLGSMKPYARQLVVSTGKADWAHDVTSVSGSLAYYLNETSSSSPPSHKSHPLHQKDTAAPNTVPGVHSSGSGTKTTILNGSHHSISDEPNQDTVLVFPDYKVLTEVDRSTTGAKALWADLQEERKGHVLPYACVILLCSHKKRDNRCHIAAPKLEHGLSVALEREHWEVHTQLSSHDLTDALSPPSSSSSSSSPPSSSNSDSDYLSQLKSASDSKRALIVKVSHIGGHKFSGNLIIYKPTGASVWYGRVTPHNVEAVVRDTIIGGKVIPMLLRGGLNLVVKGKGKTLNDW